MRSWLRTPVPAVLVHLLLEWKIYLHFNSDIVNFVWKTNEERGRGAENIVLLIFVLWRCFTCRWVRSCGLGRRFYLGPAEISSFSSRDLYRRNKHDLFWLVVSTGYFYILFLWAIVVWKISKWSTWYISNSPQKKLHIEKK